MAKKSMNPEMENNIRADLAVMRNEVIQIGKLIDRNVTQLNSVHKTIYGYEETKGIFSRLDSLESKMAVIWRAVGIFGAAVITVLINLVFSWYKR